MLELFDLKYAYMRKLILFTLLYLPALVNAQSEDYGLLDKIKKPKAESHLTKPPKGAKYAIAEYRDSGDSLFLGISKALLDAGYTPDTRDKELLLITTEGRELKQTTYKLRIVVNGNKVNFSSKWMTNVTASIWGAKLEQTWYETEMKNMRGNIQNAVWHDVMTFIESTKPINISFEE